jgi:hypothetical protein
MIRTGSSLNFAACEDAFDLGVQRPLVVDQLVGERTGLLEELAIGS